MCIWFLFSPVKIFVETIVTGRRQVKIAVLYIGKYFRENK